MCNNNEFYLKVAAIGPSPILRISEADYNAILEAKRILSVALSIEEKYDLALCNFLEFEKELLSLAADNMVKVELDYNRLYLVRSSLNRKMVNFLNSGRMYTEQISSQASRCVSSGLDIFEMLEHLKREIYDQSLNYRAMEALRNHVIHSGVAVHVLSLPSYWTLEEDKDDKELVFNIDIFSDKSILADNPKFKRKVLDAMPERFDLKRAARSYMGSISRLNDEARRVVRSSVDESRATIEYHLDEYKKVNKGKAFAVGAYNYPIPQKRGALKKPVTLMLDWDDVRRQLLDKNDSITNMGKRYITNEIDFR